MPGNRSITFGKWGEQKALEYLESKGYSIITKSFHSRFGEVDIVAKNKEYLTFTEVKTRKNAAFAYPREYVSRAKQRKVISAAKYFMSIRPINLQPRFDVIEVYAPEGVGTEIPEIIHIENAFGV